MSGSVLDVYSLQTNKQVSLIVKDIMEINTLIIGSNRYIHLLSKWTLTCLCK